jgi:hypothetical protein
MIAIRSRDGVVSRMEIRLRALETGHPDIVGKKCVPCAPELARRQTFVVIEVNDLTASVHTRIGATRRHDTRASEDPREGIFAYTLNGCRVGLSLPAAICGSIVLEDGSDAQST